MTDKELNHDYSFHVLHEQVAKTDLFEDKTHEKVATTLNKLMTQEEYGLTIGLEGSWGSGLFTLTRSPLEIAITINLTFCRITHH